MSDRSDSSRRQFPYPRINPAFIPVKIDENTYHIRAGPWSGPAFTVSETDEDGVIEDLFRLLDGNHHIDDIFAKFDESNPDAILSLLDRMADRNVLFDGAETETDFGDAQLLPSPRFQREDGTSLESTEALVVSAGNVGLQIAEDLLASGVGTVKFAQPLEDVQLEVSHLDGDRFHQVTEGELTSAIEDASSFVYAANREYTSLGEELSTVADETKTPWMMAQVRGFDGIVGPTVFPGETGCYHCFERRIDSNLDGNRYSAFRSGLADDHSSSAAGLPSYSRIVAGYATIDYLHLLTYGQSFTVGRAITVNLFDLSTQVDDVLKLPRCRICGKNLGEDRSRFVTVDDVAEAAKLNREYGEGE